TVPYYTRNGTKVADDWADLTDGSLDAPIDRLVTGVQISTTLTVWTGTLSDASTASDLCDQGTSGEWNTNSNSFFGMTGDPTATNGTWSEDGNGTCDVLRRVYCIQQ